MSRDPVLRLGGLQIKVLSGPVSMHYLRPVRSGMPLVLLFGDSHRGKKNLKRDCDEEEGCYLIYSNSFLLGLDQLASRFPLDFFLEYGDEVVPYGRKDILFGELRYKVDGCTDTRLRDSYEYEDRCPTRNIRFHKSDPRRFYRYIESKSTELYNAYFLDQGSTELKAQSQDAFAANVFKEALEKIHRGEMEAIPKVMMKIIQSRYSVCRKQIQKVRVAVDWEKMFVFTGITLKGLQDYLAVYQQHPEAAEEVIQATLEGKYLKLSPVQQHFRGLLSHLLLYMNSWFTDLYTVARMLKTPDDNTPSYLSLGMFGAEHTRNMSRFLSEVGYEVVYEQQTVLIEGDPIRHVYLLQDLDVDRDVEEFKGEDVYPYTSRLEQQAEERMLLRRSEARYPFTRIDEEAKRLYGIRLYDSENLMYIDAGELRGLMKSVVGNFSRVLSRDELAYVENCASELFRFIVIDVCQQQLNRKLIQPIAYACIVASMKYIMDEGIYDLVGRVYPDLFERLYLVMEMVEDLEKRTDFQLCKSISRIE